jgi:hypothetical protein
MATDKWIVTLQSRFVNKSDCGGHKETVDPFAKETYTSVPLINLIHNARISLEDWRLGLFKWLRNKYHSFTEAEDSLPSSQEPSSGPIPQPVKSTPHSHILLL